MVSVLLETTATLVIGIVRPHRVSISGTATRSTSYCAYTSHQIILHKLRHILYTNDTPAEHCSTRRHGQLSSSTRPAAVQHTAPGPRAPAIQRPALTVHPRGIPATAAAIRRRPTPVQPPPSHSRTICVSARERAAFQRCWYEQRPWLSSTWRWRKREDDSLELCYACKHAATPDPDQCATVCAIFAATFTLQHPPQPFAQQSSRYGRPILDRPEIHSLQPNAYTNTALLEPEGIQCNELWQPERWNLTQSLEPYRYPFTNDIRCPGASDGIEHDVQLQ